MELEEMSAQELIDLFNKLLEDSKKLSTGFVKLGLINIEKELRKLGYKVMKTEGEDKWRAEEITYDEMSEEEQTRYHRGHPTIAEQDTTHTIW